MNRFKLILSAVLLNVLLHFTSYSFAQEAAAMPLRYNVVNHLAVYHDNRSQFLKFEPILDLNDSLKFDSLVVERLIKESEAYLMAMNLDSALIKADSASLGNYFVIDQMQFYEVRILVGSIMEKIPKKSSYAEESYLSAITIAKAMSRLDLVTNAMDCLYHFYDDRKNYEKALGIYLERESLLYQLEKEQEGLVVQQLNDSIAGLKNKVHGMVMTLTIQKSLSSKFRSLFYIAAGVVLLLLLILVVILSSNAKKRKQLEQEGNQSLEQEKTNTLDKEKLLANQTKELNKSEQEIGKLRYLVGEQLKRQDAITKSLNENLSEIISEARLQLELIGRDPSGKLAVDKYMVLQNLLTKASAETRELTGNISTVNGSLTERVESLCNSFIRPNLKIDFSDKSKNIKLNAIEQSALLNAFSEILLNIDKHSEATEVVVSLSDNDGKLILQVDENGRGFDVKSSITKGTGLRRIISIMTYLDGDLDIVSDSKKGTHYTLKL